MAVRCARSGWRREREAGPGRRVVTKIFASEVETTVASVLGAWRQSLRRPLRVALAGNPAGRLQPRVLSFRSRVWPELRGRPTLLPAGVEEVRRDQLAQLMAHGWRRRDGGGEPTTAPEPARATRGAGRGSPSIFPVYRAADASASLVDAIGRQRPPDGRRPGRRGSR